MIRISKIIAFVCAGLLLSATAVQAQSTPAPNTSTAAPAPDATHKPPAPDATHKVPASSTPAPSAGTDSGVSSAHLK
jgi:hypothetical protein